MRQRAGFTNVEIDADGTRRRIDLAQNVHDHWYLQLAFVDYREESRAIIRELLDTDPATKIKAAVRKLAEMIPGMSTPTAWSWT
jgi:hypothetical protein